jgi:hypothetical protein
MLLSIIILFHSSQDSGEKDEDERGGENDDNHANVLSYNVLGILLFLQLINAFVL